VTADSLARHYCACSGWTDVRTVENSAATPPVFLPYPTCLRMMRPGWRLKRPARNNTHEHSIVNRTYTVLHTSTWKYCRYSQNRHDTLKLVSKCRCIHCYLLKMATDSTCRNMTHSCTADSVHVLGDHSEGRLTVHLPLALVPRGSACNCTAKHTSSRCQSRDRTETYNYLHSWFISFVHGGAWAALTSLGVNTNNSLIQVR
jgi:hypothetical protein